MFTMMYLQFEGRHTFVGEVKSFVIYIYCPDELDVVVASPPVGVEFFS